VTGVVLASVLIAAVNHGRLDPLEDDVWILIALFCTALVRWYPKLVGRGSYHSPRDMRRALALLGSDCPLVAGGLPTVMILQVCVAVSCPPLVAVWVVLIANVVLLLILGVTGANSARRSVSHALLWGLADAALGVLVIAVNAALR
jgi:hypothetical protein